MTQRTLFVYDGDNIRIAFDRQRPKLVPRLRLRILDRILTSLVPAGTQVCSIIFMSEYPGQTPATHWMFRNRETKIWIRSHPMVDGFGYPDVFIERYILEHVDEFSRLVLISSDSDFFELAERLVRDNGKKVTIFAVKSATNVGAFQRLTGVETQFINDIIDFTSPMPSWNLVVKLFPPALRWIPKH